MTKTPNFFANLSANGFDLILQPILFNEISLIKTNQIAFSSKREQFDYLASKFFEQFFDSIDTSVAIKFSDYESAPFIDKDTKVKMVNCRQQLANSNSNITKVEVAPIYTPVLCQIFEALDAQIGLFDNNDIFLPIMIWYHKKQLPLGWRKPLFMALQHYHSAKLASAAEQSPTILSTKAAQVITKEILQFNPLDFSNLGEFQTKVIDKLTNGRFSDANLTYQDFQNAFLALPFVKFSYLIELTFNLANQYNSFIQSSPNLKSVNNLPLDFDTPSHKQIFQDFKTSKQTPTLWVIYQQLIVEVFDAIESSAKQQYYKALMQTLFTTSQIGETTKQNLIAKWIAQAKQNKVK